MKPKKSVVYLLTVLILACVTLIWVLSRVQASLHLPDWESLSLIPQTARQTAAPPDEQTLGREDYLPPDTTLLETLHADLDNDGRPETVLAFNSEDDPYEQGNGGAVVLDDGTDHQRKTTWDMRPPSEGLVAELAIRDINLDGILEVLLYKSSEDQTKHYLHIYAWNGAGYASLAASGEQAFVSANYPPEIRNVDSTTLAEIVVFDDTGGDRLKAVVYRWDGEAYIHVDWIIMLGPARPSSEGGQ